MAFTQRWYVRYGLALATVGVAVLARLALVPLIGLNVPYVTIYPAIMIVAVVFGAGPGVLAAAAGILLAERAFMQPQGAIAWDLSLAIRATIVLGASLYLGWIGQRLRTARARAEAEASAARTAEQALRQQVELVDAARAEVIRQEMQRVVRARRDAIAAPVEPAGVELGWVPAVAGGLAVLLGLVVLLGWVLRVEALQSLLPGLPTMKANAALCFVLGGLALLGRARRPWATACALALVVLAGLTLVQYLTGVDLGIDQLLFHDPGNPETVYRGRMVPATAVGFLLTASGLLLLGARTRAGRWSQQALAAGIGVLGLVGALGYIYDTPQFYRFASGAAMALHTALGFLALAIGLILAHPDGLARGLSAPGPGAQAARRLLPAAFLLPLLLGFLHEWGERSGTFTPSLGAGLLALALTASLLAVIGWVAVTLAAADAERREAESQLRSQAELMDHAQEALIVRDQDGVVLFWNRGAATLYGWPTTAALGQRIHVLLRTEGLPAGHDAALDQSGHWEGELIQYARAGRRIAVESRKTAIRAADGRLLVLESNRDITERKLAEARINRQNATLTGVNRILEAGIMCGTEAELGRACLNVAEAVTGSAFGFIGEVGPDGAMHDLAISDPGWDACATVDPTGHRRPPGSFPIRGIYGRVLVDGKSLIANEPATHPDPIGLPTGHPPLRAFLGVPMRRGGVTVGMVAVANRPGGYRLEEQEALEALTPAIMEALARNRAETALRENAQQLNRAQELAHLGSWDLDLVSGRLSWSDEAYRIFGLKAQEFAATYEGFLERVHPEDRAAVGAAYSSSLREDRDRYEIEHRIVRRDTGAVTVVHEKCEHMRDAAGRIVRSVGMVHDITARKKAEQELRRVNESLEQFVYVASHDLQEPLRSLSSFSQLLAKRYRGRLDQDADEFIGFIMDAAARMQKLITDLLEYSRAGQKRAALTAVDCERVVRHLVRSMSATLEAAGGTVTYAGLPTIQAYETGTMQVFQNLIGNALKFRGVAAPIVEISARQAVGEWVFSVHDNGIGIEPRYHERIFAIFQRLHPREKYAGTGVGLSICKRVVETLGGRIWVESTPGQGATFYFTVPDHAREQQPGESSP